MGKRGHRAHVKKTKPHGVGRGVLGLNSRYQIDWLGVQSE